MGDSGSMLVGLMLSAAAVTATGQTDPQSLRLGGQPAAARRCRCWCRSRCSFIPFIDLRAGRHPAHPPRPVAVLAGQDAPAPPAAVDRALAPPRRPDHVLLGRAAVLRRRRRCRSPAGRRSCSSHRRAARRRRRRRPQPAGPPGGAARRGRPSWPPSGSAAGPTHPTGPRAAALDGEPDRRPPARPARPAGRSPGGPGDRVPRTPRRAATRPGTSPSSGSARWPRRGRRGRGRPRRRAGRRLVQRRSACWSAPPSSRPSSACPAWSIAWAGRIDDTLHPARGAGHLRGQGADLLRRAQRAARRRLARPARARLGGRSSAPCCGAAVQARWVWTRQLYYVPPPGPARRRHAD